MKTLSLPLSETTLGDLLQRARVMQRLTQAELATAADLSLTAVRNLEAGTGANLGSFLRVARVLGLAPDVERALERAVPTEDSPLRQLARAKRAPTGARRVRHRKAAASS